MDWNDSSTHPSLLLFYKPELKQQCSCVEQGCAQLLFLFPWVLRWNFRASAVFLPAPQLSNLCVKKVNWPIALPAPCSLTGPLPPACAWVLPHSTNLVKPCLKPQCSLSWRHNYFLTRTFLCRKYFFPFLCRNLFVTQKTLLDLKISQADQRCQWGTPIPMQQVSHPPAACPLCRFYFLPQVRS